jgi:hypothetical protein
MFGNMLLKPLKERKLLGENFQEMLDFVRVVEKDKDGKAVVKHKKNYFNLEHKGFCFFDKGSLKHMMESMGRAKISVGDNKGNQPAF